MNEVIRMTFEAFCKNPAACSVALIGFGRANRAVLRWLFARGGTATVYAETPPPDRASLEALGIPLVVGPFPCVFPQNVLVRSPGVRPDILPIARALSRGALLVSETELFMATAPCPLIGVTGSDGKTTTANLTAALLRVAGHRVWLGGNNGTPLLTRVPEMTSSDMAVIELSSFQLMTARQTPDTAIVTNVTPNHLDWHTDMAEYTAAKCRIFSPETRLVLNGNDPVTREIGRAREGNTVFFSPRDLQENALAYADKEDVVLREGGACRRFSCLSHFRLPGRHNLENLLAAVAASAPFIDNKAPGLALLDFHGVPHRLQYVDTVRGVRYYNSSIDTSPSRTAAALSALGAHPLVILGGRGKGVPFSPLGAALKAHAKAAYLYGEAAGEIASALPKDFPRKIFSRFAEAFAAAAEDAGVGDTVLLSPACTAFGEFRDFEQRGEVFCRLVKELGQGKETTCKN